MLKVPKKTTWAICIAVKVGKNVIVEYKLQTIPAQDKKVTDLISVRRVRTKTLRKIETGYCSFGKDSRRIMYAHERWKNGFAS